jgi:hypothetical protein
VADQQNENEIFASVDRINDSIISKAISEKAFQYPFEGLPQIRRIFGQMGLDPIDDFSGDLSVQRF